MSSRIQEHLRSVMDDIRHAGLYKDERIIVSPQDRCITLEEGKEVLNLCANNYLGLSNHPELIAAAHETGDLERAVGAFERVGRDLGILSA